MITRCLAVLVVLVPIAVSCSVERKGGPGSGRGPVNPASAGENPFAPVQLVIHPLTRLVKDPGEGDERIEMYLELRDRWEDSTKWLGEAVMELFRETPPVANGPSGIEQVKRWRVDLMDAEANVKAYDRVTRTYRLTLVGLPRERKLGAWRLEARWSLPEGRTLTATRRFD